MRNWFKTGVVGAGFVLLCLISFAACTLPGGGDETTIVNTATNNNSVPTGPAMPAASPSPAPGTCLAPELIDSVRVNPFGYDCPDGVPKPTNSSGLLPMGCIAAVTATPKKADGTDVPAELHGTAISWSIPIGAQYVQVTDDPIQPFNKNVTAVSAPGEFQLAATVCGKTGAWNGRTVP